MEKIFTGKTIDDAVESAAAELGIPAGSLSYEIEELPKKGFFGLGFVPAKIKVKYVKSAEDIAEEYLAGLFGLMGLEGCKTVISADEEKEQITIQIDGEAANVFVARQGDAVEALQMIIALTVNREIENKKYKIALNINDYRNQAKERLENLAVRIASQVQKSKKRTTLNPMSAFQRRIIHAKLQDEKDITTFSIGEEPNRRVVIAYQGADAVPYQKRENTREFSDNREGFKKLSNSRPSGDRKPYGDRKPSDGRPSGDGKPYGEKKPYGDKKPYNNNQNRPPRTDSVRVNTPQAETPKTEVKVDLKAGEKRANK